jgi:beta-lactamase superfamily II metal-dependent hydrolase
MKRILLLVLCAACCAGQQLQVYAIDVEGGKSTLYVSPSGQSMLVDAGYEGFNNRDAGRIASAAQTAGVKRIDYLVITHYHKDHMGGVPQLAAKLPIRNFIDHGQNFETVKDVATVYNNYLGVRAKGRHYAVKAGNRIPIDGIEVDIVTASGAGIANPMAGAGQANPLCESYKPLAPDLGENARSIGMVVTFGKFRLVDLGDLYWNQEHDLVCPNNLLGTADVYMTTHHAKATSGSPQMVHALRPKAAIMNNGPVTGGSELAWQTIHTAPGVPDIWQLHYALNNDKAHNAPAEFIANPEEKCMGHWIQLSAKADGSFSIRNGRTQFEKAYR